MKRAWVYDIRKGDTDYLTLLSPDNTYIFWDEKDFPGNVPGEPVFFVYREEEEALFAIATDVLCDAKCYPETMMREFTYLSERYSSRTGDVFRKFEILQRVSIPRSWKWQKPFRHKAIATLSIDNDNNEDRLCLVHDLLRIFTNAPARYILDSYNIHVANTEVPINQSKIKVQIMTPTNNDADVNPSVNPLQAPGLISFDDPYRKILIAARTKPFVLLVGVSGSGKSWTANKLAYLTCADEALRQGDYPDNLEMVHVNPGWFEPDELFGYHTQQGDTSKYHCTDLLRFMVKAWQYPHIPFWVCLDEMNLAQTEHYFSDYLSILESRKLVNGKMVYRPFIKSDKVKQYTREDTSFWSQLGLEGKEDLQRHFLAKGIAMPSNLIVVGTLNRDETTKTVSIRLMDRAMVIEMKAKEWADDPNTISAQLEYPDSYEITDLLVHTALDREEFFSDNLPIRTRILSELKKLYSIMDETPFELSLRVINDTIDYCFWHYKMVSDLPEDWLYKCLDEVISMKILVRISGDEDTCRPLLDELIAATEHYPVSRQRLVRMLSMLENGSYTYCW